MAYIISSGESSDGIIVTSDSMTILDGGIVNGATITYGNLYVSCDGVANNTSLGRSGFLHLYSGGTASGITMGASNTLRVPGGIVIYEGGVANNTLVGRGRSLTLSSGGTANEVKLYGGTTYVLDAGVVSEAIVNSNGDLRVSDGGKVNGIEVYSGGKVFVSHGGKITGQMSFENGAVVSAYSGSILDFDLTGTTPGDTALVNNLSLVQGTPSFTISVDGTQENGDYILAEGVAGLNGMITVVNTSDGVLGTLAVGEPLTVSDVTYYLNLSGKTLSVTISRRAETSITSSGLVLTNVNLAVLFGEIYEDTTVSAGGTINVWSGGTANGTEVNSDGLFYIHSGGTANIITVNAVGHLNVSSGGVANSTTVNSWGGYLWIISGGTANNTTVNSYGYLQVSWGGVANSATLDSYGRMQVFSGATATNIAAASGVELHFVVASNTYVQGTSGGERLK